jgi:hypothetical protein
VGLGVSTATQFEYIRDIPGPNEERPAFGGDAPGTVRSRFVSTAVWTPGAVTDASGVATIKFPAPDNLTAFRVMALAADRGHRFGSGDKRFTVAKPLQLHQALPRFLNAGDVLSGGVVVHNETGGGQRGSSSWPIPPSPGRRAHGRRRQECARAGAGRAHGRPRASGAAVLGDDGGRERRGRAHLPVLQPSPSRPRVASGSRPASPGAGALNTFGSVELSCRSIRRAVGDRETACAT